MKKFFVPKETKVVIDDGLTMGGVVFKNDPIRVEEVVSISWYDQHLRASIMVYGIELCTKGGGTVCWTYALEEERDEAYQDLLSSLNED